jgi:hypothetical protein
MLRQMCRRGRLLATISDSAQEMDSKSPIVAAMRILSPQTPVNTDLSSLQQLSPADETAFNGSGVILKDSIYELILDYWNRTYSPSYICTTDLTFELLERGVKVLPTRGVQLPISRTRYDFSPPSRNITAIAPFRSVTPRRDGRTWGSSDPYGRRSCKDKSGPSFLFSLIQI